MNEYCQKNTNYQTLTEHKCIRKLGSKLNQQPTKPTPHIRNFGCLPCPRERRVMRIPVYFIGGSGVYQGMIGEGVRVRTLSVVPFLYRLLSLVTFLKIEVYDNDNVDMTMTDVVGIGS